MAEKLTPSQVRVLKEAASQRDGFYTAWNLGTTTCEALRKKGLIKGDRPFRGGRYDNGSVSLTEAGRAAAAALSDKKEG